MTDIRLLILEDAHHLIPDRATRTDFLEAVNAYNAGSLRSAIVMLWSAVVCDLVRKMKILRDTFSDPAATDILNKISASQKQNPRSSDWESALVESVFSKTHLLTLPEKDELLELQRKRHLCAHPIIDSADLLYRPTPELVRALIRTAFDAVLSKSPMLSKAIFEELMVDIEQTSGPGLSGDEFKRYIRARYCSQMSPTVALQVFRSLWAVTFHATDGRADSNGTYNKLAVEAFLEHSNALLMGDIRDRASSYSRTNRGTPAARLASFINEAPEIWRILSDDARLLITAEARSDLNLWCRAFHLTETPDEHLSEISRKLQKSPGSSPIRPGVWNVMLKHYAARSELLRQALTIGHEHYMRAVSFDAADEIFRFLIRPSLPYETPDSLSHLLQAIEKNPQCYERGLARDHHKLVQDRANELSVDTQPYKNFTRTRGS